MGTVAIVGNCEDCDFICESRNALGVMAKHSKKYGHTVHIEQTVCYKFVNGERKY